MVKGDYLVFEEQNLSYQERENMRKYLLQHARVTGIGYELKVRNILSIKDSKIIDKINNNFYTENFFEIFATEYLDWYHVRYMKDYEGLNWIDGWDSEKYINPHTGIIRRLNY